MRKHIPPQSLFFLVGEEIAHCPLTVPSGDTPCVTAGDARRVNPWRSGEVERERKEKPPSLHPLSPAGDTPCVTAGDAQKVNPWRSGEVERESGKGEKKETSQPALTVPSGDTPCVTAGDARRANPWRVEKWRSGEGSLRHQRCRTTPTLVTLSTLAVRRRRRRSSLSPYPHGFTLALLGHHPRLSMVRLRRRRELRCEDATEKVKG